jgi:penicillin-binding protein 2
MRVRENRRELSRRIEVARVLVGAVFALLAVSYWYVQIARGEYYFGLSENNRLRSVKVTAPRGFIFDRNGVALVENEPAYNLQLYRRETKDLPGSEAFAVGVLKLPLEQVRARVERALRNPEFEAVPIAENLRIEEVASIEARAPEHPEFAVAVSQRRLYAHGVVASHALGYLAEATADQIKAAPGGYTLGDWIGQKGIEATYETLLMGVNGERRVVVDSHGREMAEQSRTPAQPGKNLFTTIDLELQRVAEEYFRDRVGSAVALDPRTGEILALVSSPSYDPNWFTRRVTGEQWSQLTDDPHHPLLDRAIQNTFSPGSTIKPFLAYGALAGGLVDPEARVFCPGYVSFYGRTFHCHMKKGHGWVNLRDAIKVSCDVYFYTLGRRLGIERIAEIARGFGLGEPTGIDLQFEKGGLVPSEEWALAKRHARWYPSETISVAIGQGPLLVTPIQLARALSGLVENGRLPTPHLFLASQDPRTGERLRYRAEVRQGPTLEPSRAAIVKDGMRAVLNEPGGTAYLSRVEGVDAAGKTGTAQVVGRESGLAAEGNYEDHAWFIGFAPVANPQIVVVVFVENGGHGSSAAAPLAQQLFARRFGKTSEPEPRPLELRAQSTPGEPLTLAGNRGQGGQRP